MAENSSTDGRLRGDLLPANLALKGLNVLNTRPVAQSQKWHQYLVSLGAEVSSVPLMEISPLAEPDRLTEGDSKPPAVQAIVDRIVDFDLYQHVIFVSQNAVKYGLDWLDRYWIEMPDGVHFYGIGSATTQALEGSGILASGASGAMDTEALLELESLQNLEHQRVLIFRGVGGRTLLAESLTERGANVDYCELYERTVAKGAAEAIANSEWAKSGKKYSVVSAHSGETMAYWSRVIDRLQRPQWREIPLLLPSQRVCNLAEQEGFSHCICSTNASDAEMAKALTHYLETIAEG